MIEMQYFPKLIIATATVLLAAGCASPPPLWNLNGRSQQELNDRHVFCDQYAVNNAAPAPMYSGNPYAALASLVTLSGQAAGISVLYNACMKEAGFSRAN